MALRPLAFGARFRSRGRTVKIDTDECSRRYVVQVERAGRDAERREHATQHGALRDFVAAWRARLH